MNNFWNDWIYLNEETNELKSLESSLKLYEDKLFTTYALASDIFKNNIVVKQNSDYNLINKYKLITLI